MNFASPWFLLGLFGIALPIYLHLFYRKKPVRKLFSSLRLIKLSVEFSARKKKIRNILLLLLRCAIIFFAVLALARPFVGDTAAVRASAGTPAAFVVLLDNSMSMGCTQQGISIFNSAKARALEIVDQMQPGDRAAVGMLNDPGRLAYSQLTWDSQSLKKALANTRLTMAGTNIASSLLPAMKLLAPLKNYRRAVYIVTDLTKSAWQPFIDKYDLEKVDPSIDLIIAPIAEAAPENLSITGIKADAPVVTVGMSVPIKVSLKSYSQQTRSFKVFIVINGKRKHERTVSLSGGAEKEITIPAVFSKAGANHVMAEIPSDSLPFDDKRHLALNVFEPEKVLIVKSDTPLGQAENTDDIFLRFALNPLNRANNTFISDVRAVSEAQNASLSKYASVCLLNLRRLEKPFIKKLSEYLLGGGNLITFLGSRTEPEWYNTHLIDELSSGYLLPARIYKRVGNSVSRSVAYQMTDIDLTHPAFKIFKKEGSGDVSRAQIFEFFQIKPNPASLLLAKMSHGLPAMVEEKRGQGRSLLIPFSADTAFSDWPLKTTWLPFIHETLISMAAKSALEFGDIRPQAAVSGTIASGKAAELFLQKPDNTVIKLALQKSANNLVYFSTNETNQTGFYKLLDEKKACISAFAVNSPSEESNLERIALKKIPRFKPLIHKTAGNLSVKQKVSRLREGYDLSFTALLLLTALMLVECRFSNLVNNKRGEA